MTLPLIYALNNASAKERRRIIGLIKKHSDNKEKVRQVIRFVHQSGGLDYARKAMYDYREKAFQLLHEFPESDARDAMEQLVVFVTERRR